MNENDPLGNLPPVTFTNPDGLPIRRSSQATGYSSTRIVDVRNPTQADMGVGKPPPGESNGGSGGNHESPAGADGGVSPG